MREATGEYSCYGGPNERIIGAFKERNHNCVSNKTRHRDENLEHSPEHSHSNGNTGDGLYSGITQFFQKGRVPMVDLLGQTSNGSSLAESRLKHNELYGFSVIFLYLSRALPENIDWYFLPEIFVSLQTKNHLPAGKTSPLLNSLDSFLDAWFKPYFHCSSSS